MNCTLQTCRIQGIAGVVDSHPRDVDHDRLILVLAAVEWSLEHPACQDLWPFSSHHGARRKQDQRSNFPFRTRVRRKPASAVSRFAPCLENGSRFIDESLDLLFIAVYPPFGRSKPPSVTTGMSEIKNATMSAVNEDLSLV